MRMCMFRVYVIASLVVMLVGIAPVYAVTTVSFDSDGALLVDGERTFVYGSFRDPSDDWTRFDGLQQARFNLTHSYEFETRLEVGYVQADIDALIADAQQYLQLADAAGVGVYLGLPREAVWTQDNAMLTQYVNTLKSEPALWFWYIMDEPTGAGDVAAIQNAYTLVASLDANHPAVIVDSGIRLRDQVPMGLHNDSIWVDRYHIPYGTFEITRNIELVQGLYADKPIWAVPESGDRQSYLHPGWMPDAYPSRVVLNDATISNSPKALRAQAHACIAVNNVMGLVYYWGPDWWMDIQDDTPALWQGHVDLGLELSELSPALLSQDIPPGGVQVGVSRDGMQRRLDALYYDQLLGAGDYPTTDHMVYWTRSYQGSVFMGFATEYVPRQIVTVELPFEVGRIVQYPGQRTIVTFDDGQTHVDQVNQAVTIYYVPDRQTFSFVLNDADSAVFRFDPVDPTVGMSWSEDFTGANGAQPSGWTVHQGLVDIRSNEYTTRGNNGSRTVATYNESNALAWADYDLSCRIKQNLVFPTGTTGSPSYPGVAFRVQDDDNYYLASVRKLSGWSTPSLVLSLVQDGQVSELAVTAIPGFDVNIWYDLRVAAHGTNIQVGIWRDGIDLGSLVVLDDTFDAGSVGVDADMPVPYMVRYDDFVVSGRQYTAQGRCDQVLAQGYSLTADLNRDCYVEWADFGIFAGQWQRCMNPEDTDCDRPWE